MNSFVKKAGVLLFITVFVFSCNQQEPKEPDPIRRKSPIAIASVKHDSTYIKIVYGQPYKNGRTIFGELVPYNAVWRTGANEATELTTTQPIWINGEKLDRGTYAIFSIPKPETWTIIFNAELGQWGAFEYDATKDVLHTDVPATPSAETTEVFTIQFAEVTNDSTAIIIKWAQTDVRIPVSFSAPPEPAS
ncbi:MAG: DUF2911 domain-containing protein [Balneolaceae bacterium]|nr:DUF2911 domain-containing protein [Balneolaceae bacterium]